MEKRICTPESGKRLFWLCFMIYMLSCLGRYNYMAVMAELIASEGFTKAGAGLIGTAMFMVYGVCQLVTGLLGDRVSPKRMIVFGLAGSGLLNLAMGCVSAQPVMLVLWMANGVFQACMWSPVARLFAEKLPETMKKRASSDAAATLPVATILVYLMVSLCIRFAGWRLAFLLPGVIMLLEIPFWIKGMGKLELEIEEQGAVVEVHRAEAKQGNLLHLLVCAGIPLVMLGALSHGLLKDGIQSWLPTFLTETFRMTTDVSVATSLILPVVSIFAVMLTRWLAAHHIRNELRGAGGFFAVALLSLGVLAVFGTRNALLSLAMLTLASTAMVGANILVVNLVPMHFGKYGRASSVTGILNCSAYAGSAISSFGIGAVVERAGWGAGIWFWLGFSLLGLVMVLSNARRWHVFSKNL